jgi:hypothetical protein
MKKIILSSAVLITLLISCKKEESFPKTNVVSPQLKATTTPSPMPQNQAYLAEGQLNGACSGGPIISRNASLRSFDAPTALNETVVLNNNCDLLASAYNKSNGLMYLATRNTTNGISELYAYNQSTGTITLITSLTLSSTLFYVNEMEFDDFGNLYLLRTGNDRNLFQFNFSTNSIVQLSGTLFPVHVGTYKEALAYNPVSDELKLIYEINAVSGPVTYSSTINLSTLALSNTATHAIPNATQYNISAYFDNANLYFIRDNGAGSGTVYTQTGTIVNTVSCRNNHDATWKSALLDHN